MEFVAQFLKHVYSEITTTKFNGVDLLERVLRISEQERVGEALFYSENRFSQCYRKGRGYSSLLFSEPLNTCLVTG